MAYRKQLCKVVLSSLRDLAPSAFPDYLDSAGSISTPSDSDDDHVVVVSVADRLDPKSASATLASFAEMFLVSDHCVPEGAHATNDEHSRRHSRTASMSALAAGQKYRPSDCPSPAPSTSPTPESKGTEASVVQTAIFVSAVDHTPVSFESRPATVSVSVDAGQTASIPLAHPAPLKPFVHRQIDMQAAIPGSISSVTVSPSPPPSQSKSPSASSSDHEHEHSGEQEHPQPSPASVPAPAPAVHASDSSSSLSQAHLPHSASRKMLATTRRKQGSSHNLLGLLRFLFFLMLFVR